MDPEDEKKVRWNEQQMPEEIGETNKKTNDLHELQ